MSQLQRIDIPKCERQRDSGLDLFRTICMLMVVILHYFGHGDGGRDLQFGSFNWGLSNITVLMSMVAVNGFVLISGYYLCTSEFRIKKWLSIYIQAMTYSVGIYVILSLIGLTPFSIKELIHCVMVFSRERYWFVTTYLLLYAISPFLNLAIQAMDQRQHAICCCVLLVFFSLLPTIMFFSDYADLDGGNSLLWFTVLYIIAAYIRIYPPRKKRCSSAYFLIYLGCILIMFSERFWGRWLGELLYGRTIRTGLSSSNYSAVVTVASIALFGAFRQIEVTSPPIRNVILLLSSHSFAVYLIHDNSSFRAILWNILSPAEQGDSAWMLPYMVICVTSIFVIGCCIEAFRRYIFKILRVDSLIDRISDRIYLSIDRLW